MGVQQAEGFRQSRRGGHCEPGCCSLRSDFLSLRWRWRRSFRLFCLGFLSTREHRSREVLRDEGPQAVPAVPAGPRAGAQDSKSPCSKFGAAGERFPT